ncbi:MAG: autoinducer binding domain-containing protein [Caulobacteraceae bacterium]|nr:autoinducer binding domain-containing protein [Caulobacter sp.]
MTPPQETLLQRFAARADGFTDAQALTAAAREAAAPDGVTAVSANLVLIPGRDRRPDMLIGDDPWRDWALRYRRQGFSADDPALRMLSEANRPFTWSQARSRYRTSRSDYVMDACQETTGFADAVVVPVRDTDNALLSTTFLLPESDLDPADLARFLWPGYYYAVRGRELATGFALEPTSGLTERETECLEWVLRGKSDFEIGVILSISPRTAHNHVEAAKRKLGCGRRSLAAHEAWRRGWII